MYNNSTNSVRQILVWYECYTCTLKNIIKKIAVKFTCHPDEQYNIINSTSESVTNLPDGVNRQVVEYTALHVLQKQRSDQQPSE